MLSALFQKLFSKKGAGSHKSGKQTKLEQNRKEGGEMPEEAKEKEVVEVKEEEKAPPVTEETKEEEVVKEEEQKAPVVESTSDTGDGRRVEDLVTKDDLAAALSAIEAKMEALVKENNDLKQALSEVKEEKEALHEKYEVGDFGGFTNRNAETTAKKGESFADYARQFM